jgi:hypothetical protein
VTLTARILRRGVIGGAAALAFAASVMVPATVAAPALAAAPSWDAAHAQVRFGNPLVVGPDTISNWGGYVAHGETFTKAKASWTIADVDCVTQHDLYAPWVGIDGDGTQTVEQTGVATDCYNGVPHHQAWYEMYPSPPVYYPDPISTGDKFTATVVANGSTFTLTITDKTKGWTEQVTQVRAVSKATAEAVIEAPGGYPDITSVDFKRVKFNGKKLGTFDQLVAYETRSGTQTIYGPTPIKRKMNFKMQPE